MRPLLSYRDVAEHNTTIPTTSFGQKNHHEMGKNNRGGSKYKKRGAGRNNYQGNRHWDDLGASQSQELTYEEEGPQTSSATTTGQKRKRENDWENQSRELTHEEIWDDSALINAWDAAMEEYKAMNGPDKGWKAEPTNKSALWYNVPKKPEEADEEQADVTLDDEEAEAEGEVEDDSRPIDFDSFVPDHDATLDYDEGDEGEAQNPFSGVPPQPDYSLAFQLVPGPHTREEVYQKAVAAWYWAGYWNGVYNTMSDKETPPQSRQSTRPANTTGANHSTIASVVAETEVLPKENEDGLLPT
ncbi:hypothetical protein SISSUDRAFT_1041007 [Sistotremastrum suecicum HHB10207 ss-3]|uniref:Survival Motor Neuron Gemin2-binding domain-containing protein n=1 Tax=Sistotremastrum suecicum HHB10207 ss-3 TaxID=1314776 RepID=A0A166HIN8_9AGAM|nr:hypothetical protein SISSUDRAFT_1041007 [Sistotremastrum suecicum HHB10207 ss-3]